MEDFNLELIVKICKLKYIEKLQQKDIAKQLKLSTAKVTRMLQKAFDMEIIQVNILDPQNTNSELESELEKKYGLKRVLVAKKEDDSKDDTKKIIGKKLAGYLMNIFKDNDCI
jgi:deoxyribonucleoside regulator